MYRRMALRVVGLLAGFLAVAFTPRHQGFHDMIAGCLVVRTGKG